MPYTKDGIPYQANSTTSHLAADSVADSADTQRLEVLLFIQSRGAYGATDEEIHEAMGVVMNSVRPRRGELVKMGLVANSGEVRKTRQNRWATVWKPIAYCPDPKVLSKKVNLKQENLLLKARVLALKTQIEQAKAELERLKADKET